MWTVSVRNIDLRLIKPGWKDTPLINIIKKVYSLHWVDDLVSCVVEDSSSRKLKTQSCRSIGEYLLVALPWFMNWLNPLERSESVIRPGLSLIMELKCIQLICGCTYRISSLLSAAFVCTVYFNNGQLLSWKHLQLKKCQKYSLSWVFIGWDATSSSVDFCL